MLVGQRVYVQGLNKHPSIQDPQSYYNLNYRIKLVKCVTSLYFGSLAAIFIDWRSEQFDGNATTTPCRISYPISTIAHQLHQLEKTPRRANIFLWDFPY